MPTEITTDWISAIATAFACFATFLLAIISWRQSSISKRQTTIIQNQTDIFERQAGYQGQQTTILKRQAEIIKRQTDISDQQLAIVKDQEADRKNAAMSADLVITSRAVGENTIDLTLENKGSGWAREIQVYVEGHLLDEGVQPHEICLEHCIFCFSRAAPCHLPLGYTAQTEIGPGNTLDCLLVFEANPPTNLRVDIKWVSDNGMRNSNLGSIIPRQQLELYKQEHQRLTGVVDNDLRINAYSKFMELMSVRPIDTHYAQYRILPQLETIQLYSSSEVKVVAKDIHDWAITEMRSSGKILQLSNFVDRINNELKPIIKKEIEDLQVG